MRLPGTGITNPGHDLLGSKAVRPGRQAPVGAVKKTAGRIRKLSEKQSSLASKTSGAFASDGSPHWIPTRGLTISVDKPRMETCDNEPELSSFVKQIT